MSFARRWIETDASADVVRTRWTSSRGGRSDVEVARLERPPPHEIDRALSRPVDLLVLVAPVEADQAPGEVVVDRGHRAGRDHEAEEAEVARIGAEDQPLPDAAAHPALP